MRLGIWWQYSSVALASCLFLSGCGGGGGGGEPAVTPVDVTPVVETPVPVVFTQKQNPYLPLIAGAGWNYALTGADVESAEAITSTTTDVTGVSDAYQVAMAGISYYYASSPTEAGFWGVEGPFNIDAGSGVTVRVDSLLFDKAVPYWKDAFADSAGTPVDLTDYTAVVKAKLFFGEVPISSVTVTMDIIDSSVTPMGQVVVATGYGDLVTQRVDVSLTGSGSITVGSDDVPFVVTLTDTVYLAKGLGIVSRVTEMSYENEPVFASDQTLTNVINLPKPIIYRNQSGVATLVSSDSVVIYEGDASVSRTEYNALNGDSVSWLNVDDVASDQFGLTANGTTLPATPGSEVLYFQRKTGATDHVPLHISLLEAE